MRKNAILNLTIFSILSHRQEWMFFRETNTRTFQLNKCIFVKIETSIKKHKNSGPKHWIAGYLGAFKMDQIWFRILFF
jgi:hypothetical protein